MSGPGGSGSAVGASRNKGMLATVFSVERKVIADEVDKSIEGLPRVESTSAVEFEGLDLPGLSSRPCTAAYRHTSHGLQKQELARTESAAMREQSLPGNRMMSNADDIVDRREAAAADHLGYRIAQITAPASDAEETKLEDTEAQPRKQEQGPSKLKSQVQRKQQVAVRPLQISSVGRGQGAKGVRAAGSPHAGGSPRIATTSLMPSLSKWNDTRSLASASPKKPTKQKIPAPSASKARGTGTSGASAVPLGPDGQPKKRRRVVKPRDPSKPSPKAWEDSEIKLLKQMVATEGPGNWDSKAARLGSGRTAKALHTRWLRDEGRIIDRPRTAATSAATGGSSSVGIGAARSDLSLGKKIPVARQMPNSSAGGLMMHKQPGAVAAT